MSHLEERTLEHKRLSWFFTHLIGATGLFKHRPNLDKLMTQLNAPVEKTKETFRIQSKQDLIDYEKRFGIKVMPDGNDHQE